MIDPLESDNLTPQGYDVTVADIEAMYGTGSLLKDGKVLPVYHSLMHPERPTYLGVGQYLVTFNETVSVPVDMCAFLWPRSTLLRMGASLQTAVWDAGYSGIGSSLILVTNPNGVYIERGARIGQLVFHQLEDETDRPYAGQYQGGKRG